MQHPILTVLRDAPEFRRMEDALSRSCGPVAAFGLQESHKAHIAAVLSLSHTVLLVSATDTGAARLWDSVRGYLPDASLFLPRETPLVHVMNASSERAGSRASALSSLLFRENRLVICSMGALLQRLAPRDVYVSQCVRLKTGDETSPRALVQRLAAAGYERVELVEGRGQVASRGDLVDVYPPDARYPIRVEFWGDTIDQMRDFDPITQRSVEQRTEALLPPAYETPQTEQAIARALRHAADKIGFETQVELWQQGLPAAGADAMLPLLYPKLDTLLDYLPESAVLVLDEPARLEEAAKTAEMTFAESVTAMLERGEGDAAQGKLQLGAEETLSMLNTPRTAACYALTRPHHAFPPKEIVQFLARPAPQYMGDTEELLRDVRLWKQTGEAAVLFAGEHAKPLFEQLAAAGAEVAFSETLTRPPVRGEVLVTGDALLTGFAYPELHLTVLGASELFGKRSTVKKVQKKRNTLSFSELSVGDYVVHEAHGIGRFVGVESLTVDGSTRDYLLLEYRGGDRLYIPTDQMDRVQKYVGGGDEDTVPHLSKLGGSEWQGRVNRAKASAKKLAVDLAELYAARASVRGFAFSKDTPWQTQLEERFPYQETPDQLESIREIKADMERPHPMDRLLCGDVGYGKTEVALRAAFKAVQDSKQVAFLVPTTILAEQHYNTLSARFSDFPVRTARLSRFQSAEQRKQVKKKLAAGEIDIVVGTHALLAKDVRFKDLGLLIIDEEHRFGVNHKEQIKALRQEIDVLTLTATPIPRTLNLSMSGIRDISVIETPPDARYPVQTFVLEYTDGLVTDAVTRELSRGGQVYIVNNRVRSIEQYAEHLRELLPEATVLVAHGQMPEKQLEQAMMDFMEHKADVLLCSTIIESGLDIPNANTLLVLEADRMGLAQLYQLKGRVGRSTRLGYAYFTVQRGRAMNEKAHKRLMAIREFTQFGAGFQLAMRDLEIRGAGSLLGAEQHGHIADIGYEYYLKIVQAAVREARGEETPLPETDVTLDIPMSAHIPAGFIPNEVQRLSAYRRIADAEGEDAQLLLREELEDRYGELPEEVENLFLLAKIKQLAKRAYIGLVTVRDGEAKLSFLPDAPLDGGKLLGAVSNFLGAQLLASEPPAVRIRQKNVDAAALARKLPQFIYTIVHCVDAPERI
ncbi:MAG: transcription-repair coupling factor [Eubacteriales bacterium]|nr:transcription-repair coupling factor [Eubacteriales bacterium]